jgi:hypothetical protein
MGQKQIAAADEDMRYYASYCLLTNKSPSIISTACKSHIVLLANSDSVIANHTPTPLRVVETRDYVYISDVRVYKHILGTNELTALSIPRWKDQCVRTDIGSFRTVCNQAWLKTVPSQKLSKLEPKVIYTLHPGMSTRQVSNEDVANEMDISVVFVQSIRDSYRINPYTRHGEVPVGYRRIWAFISCMSRGMHNLQATGVSDAYTSTRSLEAPLGVSRPVGVSEAYTTSGGVSEASGLRVDASRSTSRLRVVRSLPPCLLQHMCLEIAHIYYLLAERSLLSS